MNECILSEWGKGSLGIRHTKPKAQLFEARLRQGAIPFLMHLRSILQISPQNLIQVKISKFDYSSNNRAGAFLFLLKKGFLPRTTIKTHLQSQTLYHKIREQPSFYFFWVIPQDPSYSSWEVIECTKFQYMQWQEPPKIVLIYEGNQV